MKSTNKKILKKSLFFFLIFLLFFGFTSFVFAQNGNGDARPLELEYPDFAPSIISAPTTVETAIYEYVVYIYYFVIIASGLFGFFSLIYAGFLYMISTGNPHLLEDAKDKIMATLFGILILLGAVLLLRQLSPQFIVMEETHLLPGIPELPGGVWLCNGPMMSRFQDLYTISRQTFPNRVRSYFEAEN